MGLLLHDDIGVNKAFMGDIIKHWQMERKHKKKSLRKRRAKNKRSKLARKSNRR